MPPEPMCQFMSARACRFQRTEQHVVEDGVIVTGTGADPDSTIVDSAGNAVPSVHSYEVKTEQGCFKRLVEAAAQI